MLNINQLKSINLWNMLRKKNKIEAKNLHGGQIWGHANFLGQANFEARSRQWGQARPCSRVSLLVVTTIIYTWLQGNIEVRWRVIKFRIFCFLRAMKTDTVQTKNVGINLGVCLILFLKIHIYNDYFLNLFTDLRKYNSTFEMANDLNQDHLTKNYQAFSNLKTVIKNKPIQWLIILFKITLHVKKTQE